MQAQNIEWSFSIGSDLNEYAYSVSVDSSNNIWIYGRTDSIIIDVDPSSQTHQVSHLEGNMNSQIYDGFGFIAKYDAQGNYLWKLKSGFEVGEGASRDSWGSLGKIKFGRNGTFYALSEGDGYPTWSEVQPAAYTYSGGQGAVLSILKFDSNGSNPWCRQFTDNVYRSDILVDFEVDKNENIYFLGGKTSISGSGITNGTRDYLFIQSRLPVFTLPTSTIGMYNSSGDLVWAKCMQGNYYLNSLELGINADFIFTGIFWNSIDLDPNSGTTMATAQGNTEIFLSKWKNDGTLIWGKSIGGAGNEQVFDSKVDQNGDIYLLGQLSSPVNFGSTENPYIVNAENAGTFGFLAKYNENGTVKWVRLFSGLGHVTKLIVNNGKILVYHNFDNTISYFDDCQEVFLDTFSDNEVNFIQIDTAGEILMFKSILINAENGYTSIDMDLDINGNAVITSGFKDTVVLEEGFAHAANGASDILVAKMSLCSPIEIQVEQSTFEVCEGTAVVPMANGAMYYQWCDSLENGVAFYPETSKTYSVVGVDSNGCRGQSEIHVIVTPQIEDTILIDIDPGDSIFLADEWQTQSGIFSDTFSASSGCDSVVITTLTVDSTEIHACSGDVNNQQWAYSLGGNGDETIIDLATDGCGNAYAIGSFQSSSVDFDLGNGTQSLSADVGTKYFMASYNTDAQLNWLYKLPYRPTAIAVTDGGRIGLTGTFRNTVDFDLKTGVEFMTANGGNEIFITTYDAEANLIWAKQLNGNGSDWSGDIAFGTDDRLAITVQIKESDTIDINPDVDSTILITYDYQCCGQNKSKKFITCVDQSGNYLWSNIQGLVEMECNHLNNPGHIAFDSQNKLVRLHVGCGFTESDADYYRLEAFNSAGEITWSKSMAGPGVNDRDRSLDISLDESDNIYILSTMSNGVHFDQNGNNLSNEFANSQGTYDFVNRYFVAKFNTMGIYQWSTKGGYTLLEDGLYGIHGCSINSLDVRNGKVAISGSYRRRMDFDPDTVVFVLNNYDTAMVYPDYTDGYVSVYDYNGNFILARALNGSDNDTLSQVAIDPNGNIILAGIFYDTTDLDFDTTSANLVVSNGGADLVFAKLQLGPSLPDTSYSFDTISICDGSSIWLGGAWQTTAGVYTDTVFNYIGADDSIYVTTLNVNQIYSLDSVALEICAGDSVFLGGAYHSSSGTFVDTLASANGCDSIVVTDLSIGSSTFSAELNIVGNLIKANYPAEYYTWIDCDQDTVIQTTTMVYLAPTFEGNFAVTFTIDGCTDTSQCIYFDPSTMNKWNEAMVGYPTEVHETYNIKFETPHTNIQIQIFGMQGQLVATEYFQTAQYLQLDATSLAKACYFIYVTSNEGSAMLKFMKTFD